MKEQQDLGTISYQARRSCCKARNNKSTLPLTRLLRHCSQASPEYRGLALLDSYQDRF